MVEKYLTFGRPEAVIFDFDGVIVDTEPLHYKAFQGVLGPLGIGFPWEEYVVTYMGFDDRDAFAEAFRAHGKSLDEPRLKALVASKSRIFQDVIRDGVHAYPGAVSLITSLHASGIPLAISSGALLSDITPILMRLAIAPCFPHIVTADDVRKSKPDPESYTLAFQRLKRMHPALLTTPDNSLAVEDTPAGIRSAKRAGLRVLAVSNSYGEEELAEADYLTDSLINVRISGSG
jgi:beta-phosphoglucomutase